MLAVLLLLLLSGAGRGRGHLAAGARRLPAACSPRPRTGLERGVDDGLALR